MPLLISAFGRRSALPPPSHREYISFKGVSSVQCSVSAATGCHLRTAAIFAMPVATAGVPGSSGYDGRRITLHNYNV